MDFNMDMRCGVSHQQVRQLLHNKFVVILGDSNLRAVYKDLVLLLQKDKYLTQAQLKTKGETSFERDRLIEGGSQGPLNNGTSYREVREFRAPHHLVRFLFVTRVYSKYVRSILQELRGGPKPDLVIINSCLWDISRYGPDWVTQYRSDLCQFFDEIDTVLPDTLVLWLQTMPLAEQIRGGFLVPEIRGKACEISRSVIHANFYSAALATAYGLDVLDLHFLFRFSLRHRAKDGIHWNAIVHRRISSMMMLHVAQAWGVVLSQPPVIPPPPFENHRQGQSIACGLIGESIANFSTPATLRQPVMTPPRRQRRFNSPMAGDRHDDYVMRSRRTRHHYNPYGDQRRPGRSYY